MVLKTQSTLTWKVQFFARQGNPDFMLCFFMALDFRKFVCFTSLLVTPNSKLRIKPKEEQRKSSSKGFSLKHRINLLVASNQEKVLQVCRFRVFLALLCYHSKKPQT